MYSNIYNHNDADSERHSHLNPHSNPQPDTFLYFHSNSHPHANLHFHPNLYTNRYPHSQFYSFSYLNRHSNP